MKQYQRESAHKLNVSSYNNSYLY